jgi:hypothetical protein
MRLKSRESARLPHHLALRPLKRPNLRESALQMCVVGKHNTFNKNSKIVFDKEKRQDYSSIQ